MKGRRAARRSAKAPLIINGQLPTPEDHIKALNEDDGGPLEETNPKLANRKKARALLLLLLSVKLVYRTALVGILSEYRRLLVGAKEQFGTGWDSRAVAVEAHYLNQFPRTVGIAFDHMWPELVRAVEDQAALQGLTPVIPDKKAWRDESVRLMDKSARELGMDMRRGETPEDIGVGRGSVIAEDQIGKFASEANMLAQVAAGVSSFTWSGMMDVKERDSHVALEGRVFPWTTDHFLPGEEVNCRCWAVPVR